MFLCLPVYWHSLLAVVKSNCYFEYHDIRRRVFEHIVNYYGAYCMLISKPEMSNCYIIMLVTCYYLILIQRSNTHQSRFL